MSDPGDAPEPAIGLIELSSIARGLVAADAMVKASPIGSIYAGTVHPGKYVVLVSGDTASVAEAMQVGTDIAASRSVDTLFLPDVHHDVVAALTSPAVGADLGDEAIGIVETATVAATIVAGDAGVKAAHVEVAGIRLADGLGGKAYVVFTGTVAEVEAAVETAAILPDEAGALVESQVIALIAPEMADNVAADLTFMARVKARPQDRVT